MVGTLLRQIDLVRSDKKDVCRTRRVHRISSPSGVVLRSGHTTCSLSRGEAQDAGDSGRLFELLDGRSVYRLTYWMMLLVERWHWRFPIVDVKTRDEASTGMYREQKRKWSEVILYWIAELSPAQAQASPDHMNRIAAVGSADDHGVTAVSVQRPTIPSRHWRWSTRSHLI